MADNEWYALPGDPEFETYNVYGAARSSTTGYWYALVLKYAPTGWRPYFVKITDLMPLTVTELAGPYESGGGGAMYATPYEWFTGRGIAVDKNDIFWFLLEDFAYPTSYLRIYSFDPSTEAPPTLQHSVAVDLTDYWAAVGEDTFASADGDYIFFVATEHLVIYDVDGDSWTDVEPYGYDAGDRAGGAYADQSCICAHGTDLYLNLYTHDSGVTTYRFLKSSDNGATWSSVKTYAKGDWGSSAGGDGCIHSMLSYNGSIYFLMDIYVAGKLYRWDGTSNDPELVCTSELGAWSLDYLGLAPALDDDTKLWIGGCDANTEYDAHIYEVDLSDDSVSLLFSWDCPTGNCDDNSMVLHFSSVKDTWVDGSYPDGRMIWFANSFNYGGGATNYGNAVFQFDFVSGGGGEPEPEEPPAPSGEISQEYEGQIIQKGQGHGRAYEMKTIGGNIIISYQE